MNMAQTEISSTSGMSMSENSKLIASIEEYNSQLEQVNAAIQVTNNEEDKKKLEELQLNLITVLELTLAQLTQSENATSMQGQSDKCIAFKNQFPNQETEEQVTSKHEDDDDDDDDEYKRFQKEIAQMEGSNSKEDGNCSVDKPDANNISDLESELKSLEGENVRAPFKEKWGGFSYHNAVVLSLASSVNVELGLIPQILVLFSQPTCVAMLTCRFFLNGHCKFDDDECKFSHGQKVSVKDLRDYREPERDKIVSGSEILALHDTEDIWHRGRVEDVLEGRSGFSMDCFVCGSVVEVALEAMVLVYADDEATNLPDDIAKTSESITPDSLSDEDDLREKFIPHEAWLITPLDTKLGQWEKYTKGFGSKLMAQMGYVVGTGLGPKGEGRVEPVDTLVYPQGVSLDHCMRLRESSGGECLLSVEKRLLKEQKKNDQKRNRLSQDLREKTSVFEIINEKLAHRDSESQEDDSKKVKVDVSKPSLKKDSTKELNRKNFQLFSQIDKLKSEISSLKNSLQRHKNDPVVAKSIDKKLAEKSKQLSSFLKAESQVESERLSRKNMQKWCAF